MEQLTVCGALKRHFNCAEDTKEIFFLCGGTMELFLLGHYYCVWGDYYCKEGTKEHDCYVGAKRVHYYCVGSTKGAFLL